MGRHPGFAVTALVIGMASSGCRQAAEGAPPALPILEAYARFNDSHRQIDPKAYIGFLRTTRFTSGELDTLPHCAIVLHDARPRGFLARANVDTTKIIALTLGTSDPSVVLVVRPRPGATSFLMVSGLPGAGGIATQTAELGALGARAIVHIGTAGLLGDVVADSDVILARGSYKDGAAVLLSGSAAAAREPVARPDDSLSSTIGRALRAARLPVTEQTGFTVPIIYFQPEGLIRWLLEGPAFPPTTRPAYVEMEEAPFFQTGQLMGFRAASVVVGSDRYRMNQGALVHSFTDVAADSAKQRVVGAVIAAFGSFPDCH